MANSPNPNGTHPVAVITGGSQGLASPSPGPSPKRAGLW
jgi:hypothetical protein